MKGIVRIGTGATLPLLAVGLGTVSCSGLAGVCPEVNKVSVPSVPRTAMTTSLLKTNG